MNDAISTDQVPPEISVVVPVYLGSQCLSELYRRLVAVLDKLVDNFEIIMVNDASPDESWQIITELARNDHRLKGIDLSRNFGQHHAISAGIDHAAGNWVVVMDCDLQDQPEEIELLYNKALEGHDIVFARRAERRDTMSKKAASKAFSLLYNYLAEFKIDCSVANFSIISRQVVRALHQLNEYYRSYPLLLHWTGFDVAAVDVQHAARFAGRSSYNFRRSLRLAVAGVTSQSNRPLHFSITFGFLMALSSLLYALHLVIQYYVHGVSVAGWTSTMVSIFFIGGLILAQLGVVGLYLGKVFDQTKNRPLYLVKQVINDVECRRP